ncbi:unnamed protein product [Caenorhabditis sp. 36 PRJEB53466]|nr:unnamed protein product [Caenorhabditis sp. 36 PRJEB53466]
MMSRNVFFLVFLSVLLISSSEALRGALFRSGRSLYQRQNANAISLTQPHVFSSDKRSPILEVYPLVDSANSEPEVYPKYFRI